MILDDKGKFSKEAFRYCAFVGVVFYAVFGATSYLATVRTAGTPIIFSWESSIPFSPSWSVIYLTVSPLLCLAPFIFQTMDDLREMGQTLILQILIAAVFFLIWPLPAPNEAFEVSGLIAIPYKIADAINLSHNSFPSLHVGLSLTAAVFYSQQVQRIYGILFYVWAGLIAFSTLLMHEHYFIDVLGGIVLVPASLYIMKLTSKSPLEEKV